MALRFEELIERHHDEIFAYAWRLLAGDRSSDRKTDAEDLVQEVYLRAYRNFSRLRANTNHRAWLYKIATHCAYSRLRQIQGGRRKLAALASVAAALGSASDIAASQGQIDRRLRLLVNQLPAKQKACVTLRYFQDLDYPEIAQVLGCSLESARANVYQAIRRLRLALEK
ncbi:MAG: RNA polymerase sigma factor [Deltaproteobacteria bacterium]|nr:RNA polymerase sigma factor [Deltaproteobacteria bacterium]